MALLQEQGRQAAELEKARIQAAAQVDATKPSASRLMEGLIAKRIEQNLPVTREWVDKTRTAVNQAYVYPGMEGRAPDLPRPAVTPPPGSMSGASLAAPAPGGSGNAVAPAAAPPSPTQVGARERMLEALGTVGEEIALLAGEKTGEGKLSHADPSSLLSKIASAYGGDQFIIKNFQTLWPFIVSQYGREAVRDWINPGLASKILHVWPMAGYYGQGGGWGESTPIIKGAGDVPSAVPLSELWWGSGPEHTYRRLVREQLVKRGLWNPQKGYYDPNAAPTPPMR